MNSRYFRSLSGLVAALQIIVAIYYLLRGHNEPGGGFIAGLIASSAWILLLLSERIPFNWAKALFQVFIITGVFLSLGSGVASFFADLPFLTGLWGLDISIKNIEKVVLSNILTFDIGVFLTVMGFSGLFFLLSQEDKN
jgi:multisubunit Na+/H+ antiporter MnhB subunit